MNVTNKQAYQILFASQTGSGKSTAINQLLQTYDQYYFESTHSPPTKGSIPVEQLASVITEKDDKVLHFHGDFTPTDPMLLRKRENDERLVNAKFDSHTFKECRETGGFADYVLPTNSVYGASDRHCSSTTSLRTEIKYGPHWEVEFEYADTLPILKALRAHDFRKGGEIGRNSTTLSYNHDYLVDMLVNLCTKPVGMDEAVNKIIEDRKAADLEEQEEHPEKFDERTDEFWVDMCYTLCDFELARLFTDVLHMKPEIERLSGRRLRFTGTREFVGHVFRNVTTTGVYKPFTDLPSLIEIAPDVKLLCKATITCPNKLFADRDYVRFVDMAGLNDADPTKLHSRAVALQGVNRVINIRNGPDGSYSNGRHTLLGANAGDFRVVPRHLFIDTEVSVFNRHYLGDSLDEIRHPHPLPKGVEHLFKKSNSWWGEVKAKDVLHLSFWEYSGAIRLAHVLTEEETERITSFTNGRVFVNHLLRNVKPHTSPARLLDVRVNFTKFKVALAERLVELLKVDPKSETPSANLVSFFKNEMENSVIMRHVFDWDCMRREIDIFHPVATPLVRRCLEIYDETMTYLKAHREEAGGGDKSVIKSMNDAYREACLQAEPYWNAVDVIMEDIRNRLSKVMFAKLANVHAKKRIVVLQKYITEKVILDSIPDKELVYNVIPDPVAVVRPKPYEQSALWLEGWARTKYIQLQMMSYLKRDYLSYSTLLQGGEDLNATDLLLVHPEKAVAMLAEDKAIDVKRTPGYTDEEGDATFIRVMNEVFGVVADEEELARIRGLCGQVFYSKTHFVEGLAELLMCKVKVNANVVIVPRYRILPPYEESGKKRQKME